MTDNITNVVFAGLGGQGVLKASDILASAVFATGHDVKKAEVHGMSQRGGSVSSDVRYGQQVLSPMVPDGEADFLVVLKADQVEPNRHRLKEGGVLLTADIIDGSRLANKKSMNVAMIGALSTHLDIPDDILIQAVKDALPEKLHDINVDAFAMGKECGAK